MTENPLDKINLISRSSSNIRIESIYGIFYFVSIEEIFEITEFAQFFSQLHRLCDKVVLRFAIVAMHFANEVERDDR